MGKSLKQEKKPRRKAKRAVTYLLASVAAIGVILEISLHIRVTFWLEIIATYTPQLVLLAVSLLMLVFAISLHVAISEGWGYIIKRAKSRAVYLTVGVLAFSHILLLSHTQPVRAELNPELDTKVSIMSFNKLYSNNSYQQIINHVNLEQPDILAFQEIYKNEAQLLAAELGYEHWHIASCGCSAKGSDLALFSKFPILENEMSFEDELGGALRAVIELSVDDTLVVYNTHIIPPYKQKYYNLRGEMFMKLSDNIKNEANPVIVVGDFNASPASIDLRRFADGDHNLLMAAEQRPFSKCSWFGYSALFCARIDHVFVPPSSKITFQNIGPYLGSDHRAVHVGVSY